MLSRSVPQDVPDGLDTPLTEHLDQAGGVLVLYLFDGPEVLGHGSYRCEPSRTSFVPLRPTACKRSGPLRRGPLAAFRLDAVRRCP